VKHFSMPSQIQFLIISSLFVINFISTTNSIENYYNSLALYFDYFDIVILKLIVQCVNCSVTNVFSSYKYK
jgi:hypothetical protein